MAECHPRLSAVVMCQACGATGQTQYLLAHTSGCLGQCAHTMVLGNAQHALPVSCFCLLKDTGLGRLGTYMASVHAESPHADRRMCDRRTRSLTQPCASTMLGGQPQTLMFGTCAPTTHRLGIGVNQAWAIGTRFHQQRQPATHAWHQQAPCSAHANPCEGVAMQTPHRSSRQLLPSSHLPTSLTTSQGCSRAQAQ